MNSANYYRRKNLQILFNNTTLIPFKWRMKYMCFYCGSDLGDYSELKKHTKGHGDCSDSDRAIRLVKAPDSEVKVDVSDLTCEICMALFENFDEIVTHLIGDHHLPYNRDVDLMITTYRLSDLKCLSCERSFRYFRQLVTHMNNEHPINCFLCHECEQTFNKKRDLDHHVRVYHKKVYSCVKCFETFASNSELQHHRRNAHVSTCNICFKTFSSEVQRLGHMKRDHDTDGAECGFCHKIMTTKQGFLRHAAQCTVKELKHSGTIVVEDDDRKQSVKEIRNDVACILNKSTALPFKYFMNRFRCFYCSKDFPRCDNLKQHTVAEHPHCDITFKSMSLRNRYEGMQIKVDTSSLSCKLCFQTLDNLESLHEHLTSEHKTRLNKSVCNHMQAFKLIEDNFPCPFCGEEYRYFSLLLRHVSRTHTDNKFICTYCGKSFRTNPSLRAHVVSWHNSFGRYKCDCGLVFTTNNNLKVHMGRAHGTKVVQCTECPERFTTHYWMKRHMLEAHGAGYKCSYCGRAYVKNSAMVNHVRRFHLKERNVECSVCFERFFDAQRLKTHMVKHVGERNFHCDICGKKFLWKKNLRGHMSSHNKLATSHNEYGPYEGCTSERRRKNLKTLFNHTTVMPFKWRGRYLCFYCGKTYTEYVEFKKHTKSHGPCTTKDYSLRMIKGNHVEIKVDVSEVACDICIEPFEKQSVSEIVDHLIMEHNLEYDKSIDIPFQEYRLEDFRCLFCEQQFSYFGYLVNHVNNAHPQNSYICDECGVSFNKKRDLALHFRNYHRQGGYPCDQCLQTFESFHLLRRHQNNHFRQCNNCGLRFASLTYLQKHMQIDHPDNGSYKCNYCSKELHSAQGLNQHRSKCKVKLLALDVPSSLPFENVEVKKNLNLKQMRQNIQCILNMSTATPFKFFSKFTCFYCSSKYVEFEELRDHTASEHPVCDLKSKYMSRCKGERVMVKIDVSVLSCKVCCVPIADLDTLVDHLIAEHQANYDKSIKGCVEPFRIVRDIIPCPICSTVFRYFSTLQRHLNTVHSNNNRICDFCGKTFRNVTNLKVHISYTHMGSCECHICGAKYKNQWCLARHKAKHHDVKEYKCSKCPEQFHSQYQKQKHMIKVHDEGHKCNFCGRMFTRNSFMKDHIRRTHFKEKNVPCSVCNEKFFDNYLLKMHMVKHEGERKFTCEICGKAFLRRSNLSSHKEMHKKYGHL